MNEDLFDDLKQFIRAQNSQLEGRLRGEIGELEEGLRTEISGLKNEIKNLDEKVDTLDEKVDLIQNAIAEVITRNEVATRATLNDHELRLHRLEHHST